MKAAVTASLEISKLVEAMRFYGAVTQKSAAKVANRAARNLIGRAMQYAPKGKPQKIRKYFEDSKKRWGWRFAMNAVKARSKAGKGRSHVVYRSDGRPLIRNMMSVGVTKGEFASIRKKIIRKRAATAGYNRLALMNDAKLFGLAENFGNSRMRKVQDKVGYVAKASNKSEAAVVASTKGAVPVLTKPMARAIRFVANDMKQFAESELKREFAKR